MPIEIKSGKDYERHSALSNLLVNKSYEIEEAFVFCNDNYHKKGNINYFPIYMISFMSRD